jgi:hypothetical protein
LAIAVEEGDERDGRAADLGRQAREIVEGRLRLGIEHVVTAQHSLSLSLIGGQGGDLHKKSILDCTLRSSATFDRLHGAGPLTGSAAGSWAASFLLIRPADWQARRPVTIN